MKPNAVEARYIAHATPTVGLSVGAFIVDAPDEEAAVAAVAKYSRGGLKPPLTRPSRKLARYLDDLGKVWPALHDSEFVETPYETDPWETANGRVTQFELLPTAPQALWLDMLGRARRQGLIVVEPSSGTVF